MNDVEIILNLWYVVDDMGVIYALRARAYIMSGTDREKLEFLQKFAQTDYLIASIFGIPKRYHFQGMPVAHKAAYDLLSNKVEFFEEAIETLQSALPAQTPYDIPKQPLVCITPLFGDDSGNIRPLIEGEEYF